MKDDKLLKNLMRSRAFAKMSPYEKDVEIKDYKFQKENFEKGETK